MRKQSKKLLEATAYHEAVPLTPRRPHRLLKRFTFQHDTAFQLALRLTMRRVAATLAVVVALLFSAGADWDDGVAAIKSDDYATAAQEFRPLAEQGNLRAQNNLSGLYYNGKGVPTNYIKAYMWFILAEAQGYKNASWLNFIEPKMTPADISKAQALTKRMWEKINN